MKVFLTGATGVIGRRAVPLLLAAGHEVTAIGRAPEKRASLTQMGATAIHVSLFDETALRAAVAGHDAVINLATHLPSSSLRMLLPGSWAENDRVRRTGSANLARAAAATGASRFVQESFAPVYPDSGDAWIDESVPIEPVRYNRTVADAEHSAQGFTTAARSGVVLRFAAFYGPDARHLEDIVRMVRHGWAPLPGSAGAFVSSISHDDAAAAVASSLDLPAGIYNVTDDEPVTHREYFDSLADALGVAPPRLPPAWATFLFGPASLFARSLRISNRKLREASEWRPRYRSVREGWRAVGAAWQTPAMRQPRAVTP
jgi:nucleoside-diphosphate-sugar epimerase